MSSPLRPVRAGALAALCCLGLFLPAWFSSRAFAETSSRAALRLVAEGFTSPLNLIPLSDGSGQRLITDQIGTIHLLKPDGHLADSLVLDLRSRMVRTVEGFDERGLLGLALHPRYRENRRLFVYYSAPLRAGVSTNWDHANRLSEFRMMSTPPARIDPGSERVLLELDHPQRNHNGGRLVFGPDGYLYLGVGDGGGGNDNQFGHAPQGNGQDLSTLHGKILRLDVDRGQPYASPVDNPFVSTPGARPEIYAYGFRNPWGLSFDREGHHELYAVDVGQNAFEEVNLVAKGGNHGWRLREGFHGFDPADPNHAPSEAPRVGARGEPLVDPILEYKNVRAFGKDPEARGTSIIGGVVYRGKALPWLQGKYVFGDWSKSWALPDGSLFMATRRGEGAAAKWIMEPLPLALPGAGPTGFCVLGVCEDEAGEIHLLTSGRNGLLGQTGKILQLVPE